MGAGSRTVVLCKSSQWQRLSHLSRPYISDLSIPVTKILERDKLREGVFILAQFQRGRQGKVTVRAGA